MFGRNALGLAGLVFWIGSMTGTAQAVIVYGSQGRNTSAPSGNLADSGWQYEGNWGGFLGTTIGSRYFITAAHVGGSVGGTFSYAGQDYTALATYDWNFNGLKIWQVDRDFPRFAPIYTGNNEIGKK